MWLLLWNIPEKNAISVYTKEIIFAACECVTDGCHLVENKHYIQMGTSNVTFLYICT